jgi:hypothetical protein
MGREKFTDEGIQEMPAEDVFAQMALQGAIRRDERDSIMKRKRKNTRGLPYGQSRHDRKSVKRLRRMEEERAKFINSEESAITLLKGLKQQVILTEPGTHYLDIHGNETDRVITRKDINDAYQSMLRAIKWCRDHNEKIEAENGD